MSVSVVIPTHNRAHTLPRALDSVLAQSHQPLEIIVVDDGSDDETAELMEDHYGCCDYLRQANQGVSSARNLGIEKARGEWIALLDSDDRWLPNKLQLQLEALAGAPRYRLCHTDEFWIRKGVRVNQMLKHAKSGGRIFQRCLPLCVISPSSVILHHTLFEEFGLFDTELPACEDYDLWLRICAGEEVLFIDRPLIEKYGGHDDQLSRRHWGMDRFRVHALMKLLDQQQLEKEDRIAAVTTLIEKSTILAEGAEKRGFPERAAYYRDIQQRYPAD
ncbi:MAG: glycosyl transferase [gamma proteobacterium symbiont of Ctena orbiculata]|uniref:Glycosyltransferase family 2 protein n=1 Tax=Candidatus Thiodiazotropha taylori TaxID=2792791 RepID=A0A944M6V9_9GAMM|nr:glycosyltransferase family 2 protein [Candidatus Thiodiazotropha taylori]PUB87791.1 MAG: glycosyl transferase [gamma proteobacterium symbiont of Ctena orbiculata]MBT2988258.1 glycosyltransferase family 2 protein [Candidatus Thiodiazotropha taylori]MBT2996226.1 glycosyltransferase family 2 protein [Candidatus Thiodiazotropha taylori]MBT2999628.1 glycosyltransferase family 2 protein [Candidatus Thiodiazotropha taylori]